MIEIFVLVQNNTNIKPQAPIAKENTKGRTSAENVIFYHSI